MHLNHYMANTVTPQATSAFSIPIKICDGLFMADHHVAGDSQFFQTNLITHVINCAGQQVSNNKKVCNVAFLTFDWSQNVIQNITEQKVVSVTVNFIEQCRKQAGCLLIHYSNSESRPFCLLACYFMVKFKWSLFKTLEFLNSRKEDVELEPAFFQQLTAFAQKLQDKGLIRSKTWVIGPGMNDEEIIITNTYLNSKNKFGAVPANTMNINRGKKSFSVNWKKDIAIQHVYCPNSVIHEKTQKQKDKQKQKISEKVDKLIQRKSLGQARTDNSRQKRQDSLKKVQKENPNPSRSSMVQEKSVICSNIGEVNMTKKWAELRQIWSREKQKQNHNGVNTNPTKGTKEYNYSQVVQKQQNSMMSKQNHRINERLQEKLNLMKKHEQKLHIQNRPLSKKQYSENNNANPEGLQFKMQSQSSTNPNSHQNSHQNHQNNSRILHNNWIIDNHQVINDNLGQKSNKSKLNTSTGNKSVIIVKPNHGSSSLDIKGDMEKERDLKGMEKLKDTLIFNSNIVLRENQRQRQANNNGSRSSLRKNIGSQRKQNNNSSLNKQNRQHSGTGTKFFRNQAAQIISTKGRSSSAKPQRRQNANNIPLGLGLSKNSSLKGKGKWKF